jgi:hypothetical protein
LQLILLPSLHLACLALCSKIYIHDTSNKQQATSNKQQATSNKQFCNNYCSNKIRQLIIAGVFIIGFMSIGNIEVKAQINTLFVRNATPHPLFIDVRKTNPLCLIPCPITSTTGAVMIPAGLTASFPIICNNGNTNSYAAVWLGPAGSVIPSTVLYLCNNVSTPLNVTGGGFTIDYTNFTQFNSTFLYAR